jgi:hypothetical protein
MKRNRFAVEQIIGMLREAVVHVHQGRRVKYCLWTGRGDMLVRTRLSI